MSSFQTRRAPPPGAEARGFSGQPSTEDHSESKIAKESNQELGQDDDAGKNDD
jgi:hypothetical protein